MARLYNNASPKDSHFAVIDAFVQDLCKSPTWGIIYFSQPSDNVASVRERNEQLLRFMRQMNAAEHPHQAKLILAICRLCPLILPAYLSPAPFSLEPRFSLKWLANAAFVAKLQQLPLPTFTPALVADLADFVALPCLSKQHLSQGMQHANRMVRYYSQLLVVGVFRSLAAATQSASWSLHTDVLADELWRRMPDLQVVIAQLPKAALHAKSAQSGTCRLAHTMDWKFADTIPSQASQRICY